MRTPHSEPPGRACRSARPVQAPSLSVVPGPSSPAQKARSLGECPADIQRARKLSNVHFRPGSPEFASIGKCSLEIRQSARLLKKFLRNRIRRAFYDKNVTVSECWFCSVAGITAIGQAISNHDPARFRDCAAQESPDGRVPSGLSTQAIRPMSFIATFISLAVIAGAAVVILTAVVGYGCYSLFREFRISR
jgi:hypothetical protein